MEVDDARSQPSCIALGCGVKEIGNLMYDGCQSMSNKHITYLCVSQTNLIFVTKTKKMWQETTNEAGKERSRLKLRRHNVIISPVASAHPAT